MLIGEAPEFRLRLNEVCPQFCLRVLLHQGFSFV
jgi:hypothetical protein